MENSQFTFELDLKQIVGRVAQKQDRLQEVLQTFYCRRYFKNKKKKIGKKLLGMAVVLLTMCWSWERARQFLPSSPSPLPVSDSQPALCVR